jgi:F420-0:gamma-glutamyl ligase
VTAALIIRAVDGIPEIEPGDDLAGIIAAAATAEPDGSATASGPGPGWTWR